MTYESAIRDLFVRMPDLVPLYREQMSYLDDEELPYVVFGSILIPVFERAIEDHDEERVRSICAYLEEAAVSASNDAGLNELLRIEIGEWLNGLGDRACHKFGRGDEAGMPVRVRARGPAGDAQK